MRVVAAVAVVGGIADGRYCFMTDQQKEILERAADTLGEHFDNVLVSVSVSNERGVMEGEYTTRGGFYGGLGLAHDMIAQNNARHIAWETRKRDTADDD